MIELKNTKVIWKYALALQAEPQALQLPSSARLISNQLLHSVVDGKDHYEFNLWFEIYVETPKADRVFQVFGTGDPYVPLDATHLGTHVLPPNEWGQRLVWHLYEVQA